MRQVKKIHHCLFKIFLEGNADSKTFYLYKEGEGFNQVMMDSGDTLCHVPWRTAIFVLMPRTMYVFILSPLLLL